MLNISAYIERRILSKEDLATLDITITTPFLSNKAIFYENARWLRMFYFPGGWILNDDFGGFSGRR